MSARQPADLIRRDIRESSPGVSTPHVALAHAAITSSTTAHVSFAAIITALACIALIVGIKAPAAES